MVDSGFKRLDRTVGVLDCVVSPISGEKKTQRTLVPGLVTKRVDGQKALMGEATKASSRMRAIRVMV